jgi:hypothetical protein
VLVEIIIQRVKKLTPEEIALRILQFDPELCTESFLKEMKDVLPSPEQVSSSASFLVLILSHFYHAGWETECVPKL